MITVHDLRHVEPDTVEAWADHIAQNMRDQDRAEVETSSAIPPRDALAVSLAISSHGYAVLESDGSPCAFFGAAPSALPEIGVVWMLGTDGIRREARGIARRTRHYFNTLNAAYPVLWNYIDSRNTVSLRWLRWGGFELLKDVEIGGHQFHIFARTNHSV